MLETTDIQLSQLHDTTKQCLDDGYRFVTISCVELDAERVDLIYHFDKDVQLAHYRLTVPKAGELPSISDIYMAAFLVENELQDQFGLVFAGLVVDFGQTLLTEENISTSFCKYSITRADKEGKEATDG